MKLCGVPSLSERCRETRRAHYYELLHKRCNSEKMCQGSWLTPLQLKFVEKLLKELLCSWTRISQGKAWPSVRFWAVFPKDKGSCGLGSFCLLEASEWNSTGRHGRTRSQQWWQRSKGGPPFRGLAAEQGFAHTWPLDPCSRPGVCRGVSYWTARLCWLLLFSLGLFLCLDFSFRILSPIPSLVIAFHIGVLSTIKPGLSVQMEPHHVSGCSHHFHVLFLAGDESTGLVWMVQTV